MTLQELRALFRNDADDRAAPYLFADADVDLWLNEAEEEAAARADLLFDDSTEAVCQVATTANTRSYPLHQAVVRVTYATWAAEGQDGSFKLTLIDPIELQRTRPNWRDETGEPQLLVIEGDKLRLVPLPATNGTLKIECYRLPLVAMTDVSHTPSIARPHHRELVLWALYRAYSRPDT
jgi:hypothetical protein